MKSFILLFVFPIILYAAAPEHTRMLYNSLDPTSIHEHLALWELYPNSNEGKKALGDIQRLLSTNEILPLVYETELKKAIQGMVQLVNKPSDQELPLLDQETLSFIDKVAAHLPNRRLKGHYVKTEAEVKALDMHEIDLARGLFLSELGDENLPKIKSYEALLDLMALQIQARLPKNCSDQEIVSACNRYIFEELGFRFPPHSTYADDIDLYTFLPSVIDSRRGVCLGVSILYISLAQRLGLELEMVTPPGHIYVRTKTGINIETTARGIDMESSVYLGVNTRSLEVRTIREVIGMAHFNQAATFWRKNDPEKALACYDKALPYMQDDKLLQELMAYNYLLSGNTEKGNELLEKIKDFIPDHAISRNNLPEDLLNGAADKEALETIYKEVDEKRISIVEKQNQIKETLVRCPRFRAGWFHLAITYIQLHRMKDALFALERAHQLCPNDATCEYYLSVLNAERHQFDKAWKHLLHAEKLCSDRNHFPKVLKDYRRELEIRHPQTL